MNYHIDIQHASTAAIPVSDAIIAQWVECVLTDHMPAAELTIRLVNEEEIAHLNSTYRKKNKATNVLAFPAKIHKGVELEYPLLGDIIVCPTVLQQESINLSTPETAHWAHIIIHGVLHLLGYDHIADKDATIMQAEEIKLLAQLGFEDPYQDHAGECEIE